VIDVQGHRGARGYLPENTLPSFARALELGVTTLELDVALTRDGVVVIHHDRGLNVDIARGPDGRWVVSGGRVARLWDLSVADPNTTRVNITTLTSDANKFAFSPDSHWLISLGHGIDRWFPELPYTYHVWPVAVEDELRVAAQLAGRSLSSSEWNFLFPNEQNPNAPK